MNEEQAMIELNAIETRVIGALMEKALTTPQYYPLTLLSLLAACNQKSNRAPVMELDEQTLGRTIVALQEKRLLESYAAAAARTLKYRELLSEKLRLADDERALLCELLIRGAQTLNELRARASRMFNFESPEAMQATLKRLAERPQPLVAELPRQSGQREARLYQLLSDTPPATADSAATMSAAPVAVQAARDEAARITAMEERLAALEAEMGELKAQFQGFKEQFE